MMTYTYGEEIYTDEEVRVGAVYDDPEGTWEIVGESEDGEYIDIENIQEDNPNYGLTASVPRQEAAYFLNFGI